MIQDTARKNMNYVLLDQKGNVKTFKSEYALEKFLNTHEGMFYLIEVIGKTLSILEIYAHDGDHQNIRTKRMEMLDANEIDSYFRRENENFEENM